MRLASLILASLPIILLTVFLAVLFSVKGPEGFGVLVYMLEASVLFLALSVTAVVLAFRKRPVSALDIPARVLSIVSVVIMVLPAAGGVLLFGLLISSMTGARL
ncbi:hypothetical protein GC088_11885 [Arthrobacter sp. JZ12]|uniref:hypothetical protein n=1 Tax=Arthrobacter sp. JZ12 TaxID=2654190 RepID=UPI002B49CF01|nr:hypothetical protein [Arthrobacter sp. JZ12]WRH25700.1 hypothetical protein GC088_11885 [Arthrobacter sp. JZ12]